MSLDTSTLKNAIARFEDALEAARDTLDAKIADIISGIEPFGLFEDRGYGRERRIDREALKDLLSGLDDAQEAVTEAFADYDWLVRRALRDLCMQIRQPASAAGFERRTRLPPEAESVTR